MKLICEQTENIIIEAVKEGTSQSYYIKGVFLQGNIQNRNGRVYPMGILEREVQRYHQAYISQNRALGELGHPEGPTVNLHLASHLITELYRDGNNFIGKAKILETPNGKIVQSFLDAGVKLGVSSRGMGSLKENGAGIQEVQDDFYLATAADIVADPSAPAAFVSGIMENKEWVWNNGILVEQYLDKVQKQNKANVFNEEKMLKSFDIFMKKLQTMRF